MTKTFRCSRCKQSCDKNSGFFPFCSKRCQLLDLGDWALERYRIPVVEPSSETMEEQPRQGSDEGSEQ